MSRRTPLQTSRALLATALIALGGCVDDCGGPPHASLPGPGELGRGDFHYRCIGAGDPACSPGETVASFPSRIALGGRFELDYTWNDDDDEQPQPSLRSPAPERLRLQGKTFTALAYGYTAVLAVLPDSSIGDLIHLHVSDPVALDLLHDGVAYRSYILVEGEELRLDVRPRDEDDYELAGLLKYEFAVDDPSVVELVGAGDAHAVVRARSEGAAVLRASLGALTAELTVTVVPHWAPTTGSTTDSTDSTGDTDDTSDSTGDTTDTTDTTGGAP